jgi:hypothetical protein
MKISHLASFGTVSERIGDESTTAIRTRYVLYQILLIRRCAMQHAESARNLSCSDRADPATARFHGQLTTDLMVNSL